MRRWRSRTARVYLPVPLANLLLAISALSALQFFAELMFAALSPIPILFKKAWRGANEVAVEEREGAKPAPIPQEWPRRVSICGVGMAC